MKYSVEVLLQAPNNPPTPMRWLREGSALDAMLSVAQLLQHAEDGADPVFGPKTLSITITPTEA